MVKINKTLESVLEIIDYYLSDRRNIAVGSYINPLELRKSPDYEISRRDNEHCEYIFRVNNKRYKVDMYKKVGDYYEVLSIRKLDNSVSNLEIRL